MMTPDPSARCTCGVAGAPRDCPPKRPRRKGSSKKGNCCGARTRRSDVTVTTAGLTRSKTSAYEVCLTTDSLFAEDVSAAGAAVSAREGDLLLHAATGRTHAARM